MAKITEKAFNIAGATKQYGIYYTETDKFFVKNFDENIGGTYNSAKFGHDSETLEALMEKVELAIKEYETKLTELKKVIVIDLTASKSHLDKYQNKKKKAYNDPEYDPYWINHIHSSDDHYTGMTMGFSITYEVKMFRITGNQHEFCDITEGGKLINQQTIPNTTMYQIIDWTQEREDALNVLHGMFESLLDKFITSMKSPEQFIEAITTNKLLK